MKRWLVALALLCVTIPASAFWQSRDSNYNQSIVVTGGNSVTFSSVGSFVNSGAASLVDDSITVAGGLTNGALVYVCSNQGGTSVTSPVGNWDTLGTPQALTLLQNQDGTGGRQVIIFGLRNPTAGNKRLIVTGTGLVSTIIVCTGVIFYHVDPASDAAAFPNFTGSNTGATPISITITCGASNYVIAGYTSTANFSSVSDTQLYLNNGGSTWAVAANYKVTTGATDNLTGSPGHATSTSAGGCIAHD